MIRSLFNGLRARLAAWWHLEDPEERIEGSGEVILDPAYNGRYTAERQLQELSKAGDADESFVDAGNHSLHEGTADPDRF